MRKVHEKSIVLGIGIGMIITAIAGMIFSAGSQKELSKAEIISLAKGFGLVEQVQFLNGDNASNDSTNVAADSSVAESSVTQSTPAIDSNAAAEATDKQQQSGSSSIATVERNISIKIESGFKAQDLINTLLEKKVISSEQDFKSVLYSYQASRKINIGTFMFKKNEDLNYIVKTICKLK